jgi:hypothetical protein
MGRMQKISRAGLEALKMQSIQVVLQQQEHIALFSDLIRFNRQMTILDPVTVQSC